jgi:hypothetical protein
MARPAGELAGLVLASYPAMRLSEMVLADEVRAHIEEVIHQQRQRDLLRSHGLSPKRKLLLVGPPGCGKTMTACGNRQPKGTHIGKQNGPTWVQMYTARDQSVGHRCAGLLLFLARGLATVGPPGETEAGSAGT